MLGIYAVTCDPSSAHLVAIRLDQHHFPLPHALENLNWPTSQLLKDIGFDELKGNKKLQFNFTTSSCRDQGVQAHWAIHAGPENRLSRLGE
jgi:hypothetical protein